MRLLYSTLALFHAWRADRLTAAASACLMESLTSADRRRGERQHAKYVRRRGASDRHGARADELLAKSRGRR